MEQKNLLQHQLLQLMVLCNADSGKHSIALQVQPLQVFACYWQWKVLGQVWTDLKVGGRGCPFQSLFPGDVKMPWRYVLRHITAYPPHSYLTGQLHPHILDFTYQSSLKYTHYYKSSLHLDFFSEIQFFPIITTVKGLLWRIIFLAGCYVIEEVIAWTNCYKITQV